MSDMFQFSSLQDEVWRFAAMIYGQSGAGKTTFATVFNHPGLHPALVIDLEDGLSSVAGLSTDLRIVRARNVADLTRLAGILAMPDTNPKKPEQLRGLKTIIIDSLTSLARKLVAVMAASPDSDTSSPYQPSQRDYLIVTGMVNSIIDNLLSLRGTNLIAVSQLEHREGHSGPNLPPALKADLQYKFSYIWRLDNVPGPDGNPEHLLDTQLNAPATGYSKTRNGTYRRRIAEESRRRFESRGLTFNPAMTGKLAIADPFAEKQAWQVTLDDLFQWYLEASNSAS